MTPTIAELEAEIVALCAENTCLQRALADADEAGKASFSAGYSAGQAEIARLNAVISDLNEAWRADRAIITGRPPADRVIYELHQADKARTDS